MHPFLPPLEVSLSLDFGTMWDQGKTIINQIWPIFALPIGIVFGFGILGKIVTEIKGAVGRT